MSFLKRAWPLVAVLPLAYALVVTVNAAYRVQLFAGLVAAWPTMVHFGWILAVVAVGALYAASLFVAAAGLVCVGGFIWFRMGTLWWNVVSMAAWIACLYLGFKGSSLFGMPSDMSSLVLPREFWNDAVRGILAVYVPPMLGWMLWACAYQWKIEQKQRVDRNRLDHDEQDAYHVGERGGVVMDYKGRFHDR